MLTSSSSTRPEDRDAQEPEREGALAETASNDDN